MPQDMSPLPFQKSTEWIKKWMELIKKTKKRANGRECRINSVGRWVLVSIWAILIHELKLELQPSPKQVTFDPHDRHNSDSLYSFTSSARFVLTNTTFPFTALAFL